MVRRSTITVCQSADVEFSFADAVRVCGFNCGRSEVLYWLWGTDQNLYYLQELRSSTKS